MPIEKKRKLSSVNYQEHEDGSYTVDFSWLDQVVEDGIVTHEKIHRGAYPVDANGELSPDDELIVGRKLSKILGDVGKAAVLNSTKKAEKIDQLKAENDALKEENENLKRLLNDTSAKSSSKKTSTKV